MSKRKREAYMRRAIGVGSALALLVFVAALVVLLIPQPCAPAAAPTTPTGPWSHFSLCLPPNLFRGFLLACVAAALATLTGLVVVYHSLITQRHVFAMLMGVGVLAIAFTFALWPLVNGSAVFAVALSPLLAIVTLLYSVVSSRRGSAHSG